MCQPVPRFCCSMCTSHLFPFLLLRKSRSLLQPPTSAIFLLRKTLAVSSLPAALGPPAPILQPSIAAQAWASTLPKRHNPPFHSPHPPPSLKHCATALPCPAFIHPPAPSLGSAPPRAVPPSSVHFREARPLCVPVPPPQSTAALPAPCLAERAVKPTHPAAQPASQAQSCSLESLPVPRPPSCQLP